MDEFNEKVRRIANLKAYDQPIEEADRLLIVAGELYLSYMPFDLPERIEPPATVSGEFTAR